MRKSNRTPAGKSVTISRVACSTVRLSFVVALTSGIAFHLGAPLPLPVHIAAGGLMVAAMTGVAVLALRHHRPKTGPKTETGPGLALAAIAVLLPLSGLMQRSGVADLDGRIVQGLHIALALAGAALCEIAAARIRRRG